MVVIVDTEQATWLANLWTSLQYLNAIYCWVVFTELVRIYIITYKKMLPNGNKFEETQTHNRFLKLKVINTGMMTLLLGMI